MTKSRMNPAAARALRAGDVVNFLIASTPGGIEAQEAKGQRDFVASEALPKECNFCERKQLEQMGIVFGEDIDNLFISVQLPDGWKKISTYHSMWSRLVDEKERTRARIFYKAAFYDRRAHIGISRRFSYRIDPLCGRDVEHDWNTEPRIGIVTDCDNRIWETEAIVPSDELKSFTIRDILETACKEWLDEHYSDWEDPLAYWD